MDRTQIINTMLEASIYTISSEEFIKRMLQAGVTSYQINIETYQVIFKGEDSEPATYEGESEKYTPIIINLIRKNTQGNPLVVQILKKAKVQSYEVFLSDMSMKHYDAAGQAMDLNLLSFEF